MGPRELWAADSVKTISSLIHFHPSFQNLVALSMSEVVSVHRGNLVMWTERERERERERETDRQTDRQTERDRERERDSTGMKEAGQ